MHMIKWHSIVHRGIQEVCSNSSSAEVCRGTLGRSCSIDFLPDAKHLSSVEKSAFADIVGKTAWSCT